MAAVCCTVADEFVPALDAILAKGGIEHIVIETSGPRSAEASGPGVPLAGGSRSRVTVDGVVVVVDGAALADGRVAQKCRCAGARQRTADTALDHDDPIEEVFEGSDRLRRSLWCSTSGDLLDEAGVKSALATIANALPRSVKVVTVTDGKVDQARCCLGSASARGRHRPIAAPGMDAEEEHDHDGFRFIRCAARRSRRPVGAGHPRCRACRGF